MIIHVIKDNNDPAWDGWEGYSNECARQYRGVYDRLGQWRSYSKDGKMHRGWNKDAIPSQIDFMEGVKGLSVYWFERYERA